MTEIISMTRVAASSFSAILQSRGGFPGQVIIPAGTVLPAPAGATLSYTVSIPLPSPKVDVMGRFMINGTGKVDVDGVWSLITGRNNISSTSGFVAYNYLFDINAYFDANNYNVVFTLINNLVSAPITLPQITLNAYGRFFTYPWSA